MSPNSQFSNSNVRRREPTFENERIFTDLKPLCEEELQSMLPFFQEYELDIKPQSRRIWNAQNTAFIYLTLSY